MAAYNPFAGGVPGIQPESPATVIASLMGKLRSFYPFLHRLAWAELAIGVAVWLILLVLPTRNPWWRWTGWFILVGAILSFTAIQYLPVIEYLAARGVGR